MSHDEQSEPRPDDQQSEGQVSEASKPEPAVGGADATDKSTGTAPDEAEQPHA